MTKSGKKILLAVLLAFCFALCFGTFAACGDEDKTSNDAVTYTVTVKTDATTPASGVKVQVAKGSARYPAMTTDANGKAVFELVPDNYTVTLSSLPDHYEVPSNASLAFTKDARDLTITLQRKFAYTVRLVTPDNQPYYAEGVTVGICTPDGNCKTPVVLGSDGVAIMEDEAGDYHVKVYNLPKTATSVAAIETDIDGYYSGKDFSATETEMTITVTTYSVASVSSLTAMTNDAKTAYAAKNSHYTVSALDAYHCEGSLAAGETKYFSFTSAIDGQFAIYTELNYADPNDLLAPKNSYLYNGTDFQSGNRGDALSGLLFQSGKTYYFNVSNPNTAELPFEFVIETPAASYTQVSGAFVNESTVSVTIAQANANAVIELKPTVAASFKLTAQGEQATSIVNCVSPTKAEHSTFAKGTECKGKLTTAYIGDSLYFSVAVEDGTTLPITFDVKIERIATLTDVTTEATVETLATYEKPADKTLKAASVESETDLHKGDDGYYHLTSATGDIVFLNINKIAYQDQAEGSRIKYVLDVTSEADRADFTKGNTYKDYRMFIRGFKEYDAKMDDHGKMTYSIPTTVAANCYAEYANEDGAYPLTEDLLTFIKAFYATNANSLSGSWTKELYYYGAPTNPGDVDVVVGEYEQVSMMSTTTLTVNEDGTFTIAEGMGETSGTWVKNGNGTYTFTAVIDYHDGSDPERIPYTVTRDATTGTLTFMDGENPAYEFTVAQQAA